LEKTFIALVEEHKRIIYKVCYMYANDTDNLSDLYQEVVINLWKAFPRFRGECLPSTQSMQLHELYRMINCLSQLERALILLWLEDKSYQEIADIIGISRNNVALWVFLFALQHNIKLFPVVIMVEIALLLSFIWQSIKVMILLRFHFDRETVYALSVRALKFRLLQKREFILSLVGGFILLAVLLFLVPQFSVGWKLLLFLSTAIVTFVITYVAYLYFEKGNTEAIQKGLAELKELETEVEG